MRIRVHYPPADGDIALLAEPDWTMPFSAVRQDDNCAEFELPCDREFRYFKPVLRNGHETRWSAGDNYLAFASAPGPIDVYPHFQVDDNCSACALRELADPVTGKKYHFRVFYPPGYHENTLARYPVLYMQDGQNLFFPDEAFQGQHWKIAETLGLLDAMNAAAKVMVVGVYPNQREHDYTELGYRDYGRFLVEHLKPCIDREYRTRNDPNHTAVMGSSLGGVVSFYLAWQYPEVFGMAACMSSTFGYRDNLLDRVKSERKRPVRFYLDSGWPRDNYEVTREMRFRLQQCGYVEGNDLIYYAYPEALHNEAHWAMRTHIPFQIFFGRTPSTEPV
jgi:predicted alpha/beta superfamily hydrolase